MATTPVIPAAAAEPSMADLRSMLAASAPIVETKPATSEPNAAPQEPAEANNQQAATEPAANQQEPAEHEEPLPEGVQKRIAKEAEKAARIQSEIDRAVSERKAREAELAKLKTDAPGSQPAKETAQASAEKPKRPNFGEVGHESETWEQYEARGAAFQDAHDKWLRDETIREFKQNQNVEQRQNEAKQAWDRAVKTHGADFPAHMDTICAATPEGLQLAISSLEHWDQVAVHLAKDPAQLKTLATEFAANPYKAIATLGRIEAALISKAPATSTTTEKPLPEPLAKVGGNASASGKDFQSTLETGSMSQFKAAVKKARG